MLDLRRLLDLLLDLLRDLDLVLDRLERVDLEDSIFLTFPLIKMDLSSLFLVLTISFKFGTAPSEDSLALLM